MNELILLGAAAAENPVTQIARTFGVDWTHLIAQTISFSIVCVLLYFFAYKRVLTMLEQRRQRIAQGLADAEQSKAALARAEAERHELMLQANAQASRLIEEAHTAAARVQEQNLGVTSQHLTLLLINWYPSLTLHSRLAAVNSNAGHSNAGHSNAGHSNAGHSNAGHNVKC